MTTAVAQSEASTAGGEITGTGDPGEPPVPVTSTAGVGSAGTIGVGIAPASVAGIRAPLFVSVELTDAFVGM